MCDQQSLRSACAYAQSDQSLCLSLEYSLIVKLLTEHHLEFLGLKGGCTGLSESTLVKMLYLLEISCHGSYILDTFTIYTSSHSGISKFSPYILDLGTALQTGLQATFIIFLSVFGLQFIGTRLIRTFPLRQKTQKGDPDQGKDTIRI